LLIFADRIKELRKTKNLTQKKIAEAIGIAVRNYQRLESDNNPSVETVIKLADYFNVSTDYLLGRSDNQGVVYSTRTKFAERLESLRIKKANTQRDMAEYLDMHERAYQMYEYDKCEPNHEITIRLADYFNVSTDYLLGRSDNPERH